MAYQTLLMTLHETKILTAETEAETVSRIQNELSTGKLIPAGIFRDQTPAYWTAETDEE